MLKRTAARRCATRHRLKDRATSGGSATAEDDFHWRFNDKRCTAVVSCISDHDRKREETRMSDDPSSPRHGMGTGVAFLAGIALTCGILIAATIFL